MRITLEWAMTYRDSAIRPCELCEVEFEPRSLVISIGPHGFEICDDCAGALFRRKEKGGVEADWPTWEQYQDALREHPEPMMTTEELRRAEELGLYDDFFELTLIYPCNP